MRPYLSTDVPLRKACEFMRYRQHYVKIRPYLQAIDHHVSRQSPAFQVAWLSVCERAASHEMT